MFGMTSAVLLKADAEQKPEAVLLGGGDTDRVSEIQAKVGGVFDAVRRDAIDTSGATKSFQIVGYVHDEGRILNLPLNAMATMLFEQNIFGDVVLVSATNPETNETDGEDYDIPLEFTKYLIEHLYDEMRESLAFSKFASLAVAKAVADGVVPKGDALDFIAWMASNEDCAMGRIGDIPHKFVQLLQKAIAHSVGVEREEDDGE